MNKALKQAPISANAQINPGTTNCLSQAEWRRTAGLEVAMKFPCQYRQHRQLRRRQAVTYAPSAGDI